MDNTLIPLLAQVTSFDWDLGNQTKNWVKHQVSRSEAEQVFANQPQIILKDTKHSQTETRYSILGKTDNNRLLTVIFTIRHSQIRVISARDMNRKSEQNIYQLQQKDK